MFGVKSCKASFKLEYILEIKLIPTDITQTCQN